MRSPVLTATLTVLGLGPGDPGLLTRAALDHLNGIADLVLRTKVHPTVAGLPPHLHLESFDDLYEQAPDFETIYQTIAETLIGRVMAGLPVTYAVPGHPLVAEATTRRLLTLAREQGLSTRIIAGLSFIEPACEALGLDPFDRGLQLVDALDLGMPPGAPWSGADAWIQQHGGDRYEPPLIPFPVLPTRPALLSQLYNRRAASDAKLVLLQRYPANHPVTLVAGAGGTSEPRIRTVGLGELDHLAEFDHLTVAYLPPLAPIDDLRGIDGIGWVVARLLGPGGCPWDREQTHLSLRPYLLEETHEVLEALDTGDRGGLSEELGDLLLQILMHSEMARQAGDFDLGDVLAELAGKLIRRHPHVFGDIAVDGSDEVLRNWESIKRSEHATKGSRRESLLDGVPVGLPALAAAQKLGDKAARIGFDWPDVVGVLAKVQEEAAELQEAPAGMREEELGDLLFVLARLAAWLGIDAETALRSANAKFRRRFAMVERLAAGRPLDQMAPDELDMLWNRAKAG